MGGLSKEFQKQTLIGFNPIILEQYLTILFFFIFGLAGGFLGSILGVGGGIIFVPILTHFIRLLGVEGDDLVKCVLANSLLTIVFTGLSASYNQYKQGTYYWRPVMLTALAGMVSSIAVTWAITSGSWYNKQLFSLIFISLLVTVSLRVFLKRKQTIDQIALETIPPIRFAMVGLGAGIVTALSGLGGGLVMVPAFSLLLKIDIKKSISISTGVILFFALPLTLLYLYKQPTVFPSTVFHIGHVIPQLVLPMGIGVVVASKFGVKAGSRLSEDKLKLMLLLLVMTVTIKMLWETFAHA